MFIHESPMHKDQETTWLLEQALHSGLTQEDWSTCLEKLLLLQRLVTSDEDIRFTKARALFSLERFGEAESLLEGLANSQYEKSGYYHYRALLKFNCGLFHDSIELFSMAIEINEGRILDPSLRDNFLGRARAFDALGLSEAAEQDVASAERLRLLDRAGALYLTGRYSRAQQNISGFTGELSKTWAATILLIRCLISQGAYTEAIQLSTKLLDRGAPSESARYYRAIAAFFAEQHGQCIRDLSSLLESGKLLLMLEAMPVDGRMRIFDSIDGRILRAQSYCKAGLFMEAMRDLDYILMRRPSWQAYMDRSNAALGLSLYGTAYGDAQAALALEPNSADIQEQCRRCQAHLNKQNASSGLAVSPGLYSPTSVLF